jgi:hypothetical protein
MDNELWKIEFYISLAANYDQLHHFDFGHLALSLRL